MTKADNSKKTVLSGIQPSGGGIMLGNYLGALKNWVTLQQTHNCIYCVVNMHAITVEHDPKKLHDLSLQTAAIYLAAGIDPKLSTIFIQSQVPEHAELAWILGCYTWMGELSRMTQFKDKSAKQKNIGTGLFYYPVLMAADILLYQADLVPVGADQKQHIELTRDLAIRMNGTFGKKDNPLFIVPEPFIPPVGAKIMSLQEPTAKMSKSDENPNASVFITDSDDVIVKKIKRAVTDSGTEITYDTENKPGVANLINIQTAITGKTKEEIVNSYAGKQYGHLKVDTAEIVMECFKPIRNKMNEYLNDQAQLQKILDENALKARAIASKTLNKVKESIGYIL